MDEGAFEIIGNTVVSYDEWHHFVANFIGPRDGEGIVLFLNGSLFDSTTTLKDISGPAGNGLVVIGRSYTDWDSDYSSVELDELLFFNRVLESHEIQDLYHQYT